MLLPLDFIAYSILMHQKFFLNTSTLTFLGIYEHVLLEAAQSKWLIPAALPDHVYGTGRVHRAGATLGQLPQGFICGDSSSLCT